MALWALFFLGALALALNAYVNPQVSLARKLVDRADTYYLARAGVVRALAEIRLYDKDYNSLNDELADNESAFKGIVIGDGYFNLMDADPEAAAAETARYGLIDEERKLNLNKAPREALKTLFETAAEFSPEAAREIADAIVDWRDKDDSKSDYGAEDDYYSFLSTPYHCKNGDFEMTEELLLVKGVTPEIFEKVRDNVTAYGDGAVNINTAGVIVLKSTGMSGELADKIVNFREGADGAEGTSDDNVFSDVSKIASDLNDFSELSNDESAQISKAFSKGLLAVRSNNFMGRAVGGIGDRAVSKSIVFIFDRDKNSIRYWRED